MNNSYLKALDRLNCAKSEIEDLWNEGRKQVQTEGNTFEDKQADYIIENIVEKIDMAVYKLKRYSLPAIEGKLKQDPEREKFGLIRNDTGESMGFYFSCGSYLEVFDQIRGEWYPGRVEYTTRDGQKGYYFVNDELDYPFLHTGMRARIRHE